MCVPFCLSNKYIHTLLGGNRKQIGISMSAQRVKPQPVVSASYTGACLSLIQLPGDAPGNRAEDGPSTWALNTHGRPRGDSCFLVLAWPSPSCVAIWGVKQQLNNLSLSVTLALK